MFGGSLIHPFLTLIKIDKKREGAKSQISAREKNEEEKAYTWRWRYLCQMP
jgi:hypothetical protein